MASLIYSRWAIAQNGNKYKEQRNYNDHSQHYRRIDRHVTSGRTTIITTFDLIDSASTSFGAGLRLFEISDAIEFKHDARRKAQTAADLTRHISAQKCCGQDHLRRQS